MAPYPLKRDNPWHYIVVADALPQDTRALLESSHIRPWAVSELEELAVVVKRDLRI